MSRIAKSWNQNSIWIRLLLMISLVLLLTNSFERVHATCVVKDASGQQIELEMLPDGVDYSDAHDRLRCMGANSCSGFEISDCNVVQCRNKDACQGATMINNKGIACQEEGACRSAHLSKSENVVCGLQALNTCERATIETETVILCFGPFSCANKDANSFMTVNVGAKGFLRCGSGDGQLSCQNMVVEINHGKRACIAESMKEKRDCAVVCEGKSECDEKSIKFRVRL